MTNKEEIKKEFWKEFGWICEFFEDNSGKKPPLNDIEDFWFTLLSKQHQEWVEEITKKLTIHNAILKSMLAEVQDRNGLPYCKNCGLSNEDLIDLSSLLSKNDNK